MDKARKITNRVLTDLELEIRGMYNNASSRIRYEWNNYMNNMKLQGDMLFKELNDAVLSGDADRIAEAQNAYHSYLTRNTIASDRYRMMLDKVADRLADLNEQTLNRVNDVMPFIYATNYNAVADVAESAVRGYSFDLMDENTLRYLMTTDNALVPQKNLRRSKDKRWNIKTINSQVTRGILSGESVDKITDRIQTVTDMNRDSAIRNARTMTTSAENKGRLDSYRKAEADGLILTKVWMATGDERTRDAHAELDGQEVDINEAFVNSLGEIMYPGDPDASSENVWNCRCSMMTNVKGYRGR